MEEPQLGRPLLSLPALGAKQLFALIKQSNTTTVTVYVAEWQAGIDELHGVRRWLA